MMKKILASCLALSLGLAASVATAGVVVTFSPAAQHVDVGSTVQVDMSISGLGAEVLSNFDLNFFYDPAVVHFGSVDLQGAQNALTAGGFAPLLALDSSTEGNIGIQGSALADDATLAAEQSDAFLLFRFDLTAQDNGVTSFGLGSDPDFERNFVGLDFLTLPDVAIQGACIAVGTGSCQAASVPEPGTVALSLAALAIGIARRRRTCWAV